MDRLAVDYHDLPLVSFVIPAYNEEKCIQRCLESIVKQNYPPDRIEIILADGGSKDRTVEIAKQFSVRIIANPDRLAEVGKSLAIRQAQGKYVAILDADNEIAHNDWLLRMIIPLENDEFLIGMDATYLVKKNDYLVNRYCSLLRLEDPLARYMANLVGNATVEEKREYSIYRIKPGRFPIFGSGGFIWRKRILDDIGGYIPRFDEAEFCIKVAEKGYNRIGFVREVGIYHHHLENIFQFIGKRIRRGNEFLLRSQIKRDRAGEEAFVWLDRYGKWEFCKSIFLCLSIVYPAYESLRSYRRDKDVAWFLHPPLSFLTAISYGLVFFRFKIMQFCKYMIK